MPKNNTTVPFVLKENSWIARLAAWKLNASRVAIVLGHNIHLYNTTKNDFLQNPKWIKHELCHIKQFEEHGFVGFIFKYILESLRHGYYYNKYEIEARAAENEC